jgi:hypothetical protein
MAKVSTVVPLCNRSKGSTASFSPVVLESDTSLSCVAELNTILKSHVVITFVTVSGKNTVASDLESIARKGVVGI